MSVLFFSDIHLHPFRQFANTEQGGVNSRLLDGFKTLDSVANHALEQDVDDVVFIGDLFHVRNSISIPTFNITIEKIIEFCDKLGGTKVTMLAGNHDQSSRSGDVTSIDVLSCVKTKFDNLKVITNLREYELASGMACTVIPYTEDEEVVNKLLNKTKSTDILLAHVGLNGADLGSDFVYKNDNDWDLDKLQFDKFSFGFFGHFHKHQKVAPNGWYAGAPMHHNFGDVGQKRGCLLFDGKKAKFLKTEYIPFVTYDWKSYDDLLQNCDMTSYCRLNVPSSDLQEVKSKKLDHLFKNGLEIVEVKEQKEAVSAKPMSFEEAVKEYVEKLPPTINRYEFMEMIRNYEKNTN